MTQNWKIEDRFHWDGEPVLSPQDIVDTSVKAWREGRAAEYLAAFRAAEPAYADHNLGYCIGYLDGETANAMYAAYGLRHPLAANAITIPGVAK